MGSLFLCACLLTKIAAPAEGGLAMTACGLLPYSSKLETRDSKLFFPSGTQVLQYSVTFFNPPILNPQYRFQR